jgi:para-aminobenzoate synthetase / 4-amino-4-deoxychorismate lyase
MIVDLMRNDLGRLSEYGSVVAEAIAQPRAHTGVWHLVSTVRGTLRDDAGDGALLRATFPPGSVTGAPKVQAMRVIAELEATGREAYTGAIGYASPLAGLELNVVIRTFEIADDRIWLGAGGGIVADSDPDAEVRECLVKARPLIAAAGGRLAAEPAPPRRGRAPLPLPADRPDPGAGVFETLLVRDGAAQYVDEHLARLAHSAAVLYDSELPGDLRERIAAKAAATTGPMRLRVVLAAGAVDLETAPLPSGGDVVLRPVTLPGGLGAHKWRDRRLLDVLAAAGPTPLIVDADGDVLEAAHANVFAVEGEALTTPPLDGRLLPGTARGRLVAQARAEGRAVREEPLTLERLASADAIVLTSALRGPHAGRLEDPEDPGRLSAPSMSPPVSAR